MKIFLIFGYGIPEDIEQDKGYITYLHMAFNAIYSAAAGVEAVIIPCGGPTNCTPPYEGTEAEEIERFIKNLMSKPGAKEKTASWNIIQENSSLSTLENFVFAKSIIEEQKIEGNIVVFCEKTREPRIRAFAEKIFVQRGWDVVAIDFDTSKSRYADPQVIQRREDMATKEGLWTLEDPARMGTHHTFFEKKFTFLRERQAQGLSHEDAVKAWLENEGSVMKELMADHPLLRELE